MKNLICHTILSIVVPRWVSCLFSSMVEQSVYRSDMWGFDSLNRHFFTGDILHRGHNAVRSLSPLGKAIDSVAQLVRALVL